MRKLAIILIVVFSSIGIAKADYWTYMYLAYNGFMTWDMGKFAQGQAQAMVLGTVADPNSILGKTGGLLDQEMQKINLNHEEKETVAKIFDTIGDPAGITLHAPNTNNLGASSQQGAFIDSALPAYLEKAEALGMDPTQLQAMGAMNHHLARTQAFDYTIRQYENMGGHPMTLAERYALQNEIDLLKNEQLNHGNLARVAGTYAKAASDQKLAEQRARGMNAITAQISLGGPQPSTVNPEYFAPPEKVIERGPALYAYNTVDLMRVMGPDGQIRIIDRDGNVVPDPVAQYQYPGYDPNTPGLDGLPGQGSSREWRGYVQTDVEALRAQLPPQAKHLAEDFVAAGQQHNMDPLFLVAISKHETASWTSNAFRNRNNAMGISNAKGVTDQPSHASSINQMARSLTRPDGYYKNTNTVGQVAGVYAPVGAGNDPNGYNQYWTSGVSTSFDRYVQSVRGN